MPLPSFSKFSAFAAFSLSLISPICQAQSSTTQGSCSPTFTQVSVSGSITLQCDQGRKELSKLAQDLNRIRETQNLSTAQTKALVDSMNSLLPSLLDALARVEGKQDKTLEGISELLGRTVRAETSESTIRETLASESARLRSTIGPPGSKPVRSAKLPVFDASASSELDSRKFSARKAIDGRTGTESWLYSWWTRRGETSGAWIDLMLDRQCLVEELAYYISFSYTQSQIRKATISFEDGSTQLIHFERTPGWQRVALEPKRSERVRLTVTDVFPNGNGQQLQVIELELYGRDCSK